MARSHSVSLSYETGPAIIRQKDCPLFEGNGSYGGNDAIGFAGVLVGVVFVIGRSVSSPSASVEVAKLLHDDVMLVLDRR